jgi:hypothetical protein
VFARGGGQLRSSSTCSTVADCGTALCAQRVQLHLHLQPHHMQVYMPAIPTTHMNMNHIHSQLPTPACANAPVLPELLREVPPTPIILLGGP